MRAVKNWDTIIGYYQGLLLRTALVKQKTERLEGLGAGYGESFRLYVIETCNNQIKHIIQNIKHCRWKNSLGE